MLSKKILPLLLLGGVLLTGCSSSDIVAKPTDYNDPLVVDTGKTTLSREVYNNINSIIYDAKREGGSVATDVLNKVLEEISASIIGVYFSTDDTVITLTKAYTKASPIVASGKYKQDETVDAFIKAHSIYQVIDSTTGARKTDEQSKFREYYRVVKMWDRVLEGLQDVMFKKVKSGTYTEDDYFYESKLLASLINANEHVASYLVPNAQKGKLITPDIKKEDVFVKEILHFENYQDLTNGYDYLYTKIVPEIYRTILTEEYLFTQSYNTLGRSYARKVNIVKVAVDNNYPLNAGNLMNNFIADYVNTKTPKIADVEKAFEVINLALRGYDDGSNSQSWNLASQLLTASGYVADTMTADKLSSLWTGANVLPYFKGTSYGNMVTNLAKIQDNPTKTNTTQENDFTDSGKQTIEQGYDKKVNKILLEDYTVDGWYIKSTGLTDIPSAMKTRLFDIGVANAIDDEDYPDRIDAKTGKISIPDDEGKYVAKINGKFYLKPSSSERSEETGDPKDFLWYDSGTYYLCEIEEAVSASKLDTKSDAKASYEVLDPVNGWKKLEDFSHEIATILASDDSYTSLAKKYWLDFANLTYHDSVVYDYFKATFPELFE